MNSRLHFTAMCVAALLLSGCAGAPENPAAAPVRTSASAGWATLYVLNISGPTLFASNQEITDNGVRIASLPRGTYTSLHIAAGAHEFRFAAFPKGKRVAKLNAAQGRTYYLAAGYSPSRSWAFPFAGDPVTITLIQEGEAMDLMKEMKPVALRCRQTYKRAACGCISPRTPPSRRITRLLPAEQQYAEKT